MHDLIRDLRHAVRVVRKSPGTFAVIITALALGIGVNASVFTMVEGVVLHPLPFSHLNSVMTLWESPAGMPTTRQGVAPANYLDLKERSLSFQFLGAYRCWDVNLTGDGDPERIRACFATPEFFHALGSNASLGRIFRQNEGEAGQNRVVVVSHGFRQRRLGGNANPIGRKLSLNGAAYTIIGVMDSNFDFPLETEAWIPLTFTAAERRDRQSRNLALVGRLNPAVTVQQARSETAAIFHRLVVDHPNSNENREIQVVPLRAVVNEVTDRFIVILQITAGFVLLLASANVANLLLARLSDRKREIAIRTAMGATRGRIIRLLLTETILVALAAGGLGLYLAAWDLALTRWRIPAEIYKYVTGLKDIHISTWVVLFTLMVSVTGALLCMIPASIHILRDTASGSTIEGLKEGGRGNTFAGTPMRTMLAISEVTIALILLVGAGVMISTFRAMLWQNPGYDPSNLLTMQVALPLSKYNSPPQYSAFYGRVLKGLSRTAAASHSATVDASLGYAQGLFIEGHPAPKPDKPVPEIHSVSSEFFRTLRLPMIQGRPITDRDGPDLQPVAVLSESIARNYWPDSSPIGTRIRMDKNDGKWLTVVGVCGDVKNWFSSQPEPRVYLSFPQNPTPYASILIRTGGQPEKEVKAARTEIFKVDPDQPVFGIKSMEQQIMEHTYGVRSAALMMAIYALIAMFLAASGIYSVISYSVARRSHEIGVRMALGADRPAVLKMILAEVARVGAIGIGIGIAAALTLIRLLSGVLYGVIRWDAATFVLLTVILGVLALAAGYVPALRAVRVDPMTALRNE